MLRACQETPQTHYAENIPCSMRYSDAMYMQFITPQTHYAENIPCSMRLQ
jgi:hypothetical protein